MNEIYRTSENQINNPEDVNLGFKGASLRHKEDNNSKSNGLDKTLDTEREENHGLATTEATNLAHKRSLHLHTTVYDKFGILK
jgi:hypothetical protein